MRLLLYTRGNSIISYTSSCMSFLTSLLVLSTLFVDNRTDSSIKTVKVAVKNLPDISWSGEKCDLAFITMDLQANLTNIFNWNVKQIVVFLVAEYATPNHALNQVILWDKIIPRGDNAVLNFKNMNTKYNFWDDENGLRGNSNVTLSLYWNVIPNAGLLPTIIAHGQHIFQFPNEYTVARF